MESGFHHLLFLQAYTKIFKFSTMKIPLHYATKVSCVAQSFMMGEKLQHRKSHTSNSLHDKNYFKLSETE